MLYKPDFMFSFSSIWLNFDTLIISTVFCFSGCFAGRCTFNPLRVCASMRHQMGWNLSSSRLSRNLLYYEYCKNYSDSHIPLQRNSLEQTSHRYCLLAALALFLACDRSWNSRLPFNGKDLPHSPQLNGRSPQL